MRFLPLLVLAAALTGCLPATRATFDVAIKNESSKPLTIGFVKNGTPAERGWASPEQWAMFPPSRQPATWGAVIERGKTADVRISGTFDHGSQPFLRVYAGEHPLGELLAISRGSGNRLDLSLEPGRDNAFLITTTDGKLAARLIRLEPRPK